MIAFSFEVSLNILNVSRSRDENRALHKTCVPGSQGANLAGISAPRSGGKRRRLAFFYEFGTRLACFNARFEKAWTHR
jgi:hypothetical protein